MNLTQLLIPALTNQLTALLGWLDKAEAFAAGRGDNPADLLALRLAPDMWPLASQLRVAAFQAQEPLYRLRGLDTPDEVLAVRREGIAVADNPGTIDEARGQQIMETLVGLGGHRRVRVAILDVTGAGTLDARGAHALVGAARALRLRGAVPVLTGFSADTAAALTAQGIDLSGLIVRRSLQAGIAHARALLVRR